MWLRKEEKAFAASTVAIIKDGTSIRRRDDVTNMGTIVVTRASEGNMTLRSEGKSVVVGRN
jgi:hypothetical protein